MNMTVVPETNEDTQKSEITFQDFKDLAANNPTRIVTSGLELLQENFIKVGNGLRKFGSTRKNSEPESHILQAYMNEKQTLLAIVRYKPDFKRTPLNFELTCLDTDDKDNLLIARFGIAGVQMHEFDENNVTRPHQWAVDVGLIDPNPKKNEETIKVA